MSKKQITVCITDKDIDTGKPRSQRACPIAKAAKRHSKNGNVRVTNDTILLNGVRHPLPPKAQDFVVDFDSYRFVYPFKFHLLVSKK